MLAGLRNCVIFSFAFRVLLFLIKMNEYKEKISHDVLATF